MANRNPNHDPNPNPNPNPNTNPNPNPNPNPKDQVASVGPHRGAWLATRVFGCEGRSDPSRSRG